MYLVDTADSVAVEPGAGALGAERFFVDGVPGGANGTTVPANWLNAVQGSLIAVLDAAGIPHSKSDRTKLLQAIEARIATLAPAEPAATTAVQGIVELATAAELVAGDANRAATGAALAGLFVAGAGTKNGYFNAPGNVWRFQWQFIAGVDDADAIALPIPFTGTNYMVFVGRNTEGGASEGDPAGWPIDASTWRADFPGGDGPQDIVAFIAGRV